MRKQWHALRARGCSLNKTQTSQTASGFLQEGMPHIWSSVWSSRTVQPVLFMNAVNTSRTVQESAIA